MLETNFVGDRFEMLMIEVMNIQKVFQHLNLITDIQKLAQTVSRQPVTRLRNINSTNQASDTMRLFDQNKDFAADFNFVREHKLQPRFAKNVPQPLLR